MNQILIDLPSRIISNRIILRPYKEGDGSEYYQLLKSNIDHLEEELSELKKFTNEDDAEVFIRGLMVRWFERKRFVLVIEDKYDHHIIGQIWIEPIKWENRIFGIGYFIDKNNEGKGIVTEAVQHSIKFIFDYLDATKVEIHCKLTNIRSQTVAIRCNFTKEAQIRNRAMFNNGDITDLLYYGLLRDEFESSEFEFLE
ncbi:MAG: GNAT family N-acetyltransferase [Candidatus Kariarchaeaceae archaeon]|jgi:ribosomal-protein-serine acetyltransferase